MKHQIFTCLLLAVIMHTAFAQPTIVKEKTIGGSEADISRSLYLTKDGGSIAGGSSNSNASGEKTENSKGGYDYWVIKLDKAGRIQWDKTVGGSGDDFLLSFQQTSDGGYMLGGFSGSDISGDKTENHRGNHDYWIVKLDSTGNVEWDKTIGGISEDVFIFLQQTTDNGYILGGYSQSDKSGEKSQNSRGLYDYWVVKLNSAGDIQWDKTIGGSEDDALFALQQTSDGGYLLGGESYSGISGEKTDTSRGDSDYWVVKLSSKGNVQWDKTIGGSSEDVLRSLQQTTDGGYMLGGFSYSPKSGEKSQHSRGDNDYWVVKLDSARNIEWNRTIGGSDDDELYSLQQTSDGGYVLGGYSASDSSFEKTENSRGDYDFWVVKLSSRGRIQWNKTIGGSGKEYLYSVKEKDKNTYELAGYSNSDISGDKTQRSRGGNDCWIVGLFYKIGNNDFTATLQSAQNTGSAKTSFNDLRVYPNPAKNILHVQLKDEATVSLINIAGKTVLTQVINGNGEINVASFSPGLYYLKNNITGETKKVILK